MTARVRLGQWWRIGDRPSAHRLRGSRGPADSTACGLLLDPADHARRQPADPEQRLCRRCPAPHDQPDHGPVVDLDQLTEAPA